jgi:hypothetical protein
VANGPLRHVRIAADSFSSYGIGPRPIIDSGTQQGFTTYNGAGTPVNNIAIVGLDFYAGARDPTSPEFTGGSVSTAGMAILSNSSNILIEDCVVRDYTGDIVIGSQRFSPTNVSLRRNIVVDAYSNSSTIFSEGLFTYGVNGLFLEGNLFDHNGWNSLVAGATPSVFNRNIYIQYTNSPVTFIGNISAESSAEGAQFRSGGTILDNLFVRDSTGFDLGHNQNDPAITTANVHQNVILESQDIQTVPTLTPRGNGINIFSARGPGIQVTGNIIAHEASAYPAGHGIQLDSATSGINVSNNIIYQWDHPIIDYGTGNITSPNAINLSGYPDPNRTVETYDASLGRAGTLADFLAAARSQDKSNWSTLYTAQAVDSYIQAGFGATQGPPSVLSVSVTPAAGDWDAGNTLTLVVDFSEAVTVAGGSPTLSLNDGGTATYAYTSGTALIFRTTVMAGQNANALSATAINLNGATILDAGGSAADLSLAGLLQSGPQVDTLAPQVSSVSASSGVYGVGATIPLTVNFSEAVTVTGTPTLALSNGGTANYAGGSGTSALTFNYTVAAGQSTPTLALKAVNGTIADLAGNALGPANLVASFAGVIIGTSTIDTSAPTVTIALANDTGSSATDLITANGTLTGSVVDPDGIGSSSVVTLTEGATVLGTAPINSSGQWTFAPVGLADGQHTIVAAATDAAGNIGSASLTFTLDQDINDHPTVTLGGLTAGNAVEGIAVTATVQADDLPASGIAYQWSVSHDGGTTWTPVGSATSSSYTPAEAAEGGLLQVQASFTDPAGNRVAGAATVPNIVDVPATLSVSTSGLAQEGQTLTAVAIANDSDAAITFQWQALIGTIWTAISGATSSTYVVAEADEGRQLRVLATSTDPNAGTATATSAATAVVTDPPPSLSVSLSGVNQEGRTLTATASVTSDGDGGTTTYQWQKLVGGTWTGIAGATAATYLIMEADEGQQLRASVTFTDDTGQSVSATSVARPAVTDAPPVLSLASSALTLPAGGSVPMGVSVSASDADDAIMVQISGLTTYESVTDNLDSKIFAGGLGGIIVTAAEVNSGLTLRSSYSGTLQPVNTLTLIAGDATPGESVASASRSITVTDPPASSTTPSVALLTQSMAAIAASSSGAFEPGIAPPGPSSWAKLALPLGA